MRTLLLSILLTLMPVALKVTALASPNDPDARAAAMVAQLRPEERTILTLGFMTIPFGEPRPLPPGALISAGFIAGIPRLNIPALKETDAGLGVTWVMGSRGDGAIALPSGLAMASTWNTGLMQAAGAMIGGEARAKGFNVVLAGSMNLLRDPRGGRSFEYLGEDPLLSGLMTGAAVSGIQSRHVISTVKHFAFNNQETGRTIANATITDAAARESDLLAFQIAIEQGRPGAVMCALNKVNDVYACSSDYLLNQVLKRDWGYPGWVMSDWGAVHGLSDALHGLDQQSGAQFDAEVYFDRPLAQAALHDAAYAQRLADMNQRILRSMFAVGIEDTAAPGAVIDFQADAAIAETVASEGIVLLRNRGHALPLSVQTKSIAVIGGYADSGVLSGCGSSNVHSADGPAISLPLSNVGPFAAFVAQTFHRSVPLAALRSRLPGAVISYRNGRYLSEAARIARSAEVALVFATEWRCEGFDVPDLNLPDRQDALIAAVAAANPDTIVVLETGGPVLMPWLEQTAGVVEAWYPGARGAEALTAILFGDVNPSGKLPVTFPASLIQLPRPVLPGSDRITPGFALDAPPGTVLDVDYNIEGSDVGYRWFARRGERPLFPFGFGLSYTSYGYRDLKARGGPSVTASFTVTNQGGVAGQETAQLYLLAAPQGERRRLLGWAKLALRPAESQVAAITIDRRILADYDTKAHRWHLAAGEYTLAAGSSSSQLPLTVTLKLAAADFGK